MAKMDTGPYVSVAVFCDSAVIGQDQALSLIRIIDTIQQTAEGEDPPDEMPAFMVETKMVISVKAGQARGRYKLKVRPEAPDGRQLPPQEQTIHLEGGYSGVNVITDVKLAIDMEGVFWFDVLFEPARGEDRLLTRIPLRIQYLPQRVSAS